MAKPKSDGFDAMQKRLAGRKVMKPMKTPMARPRTGQDLSKGTGVGR